MVPSVCAAAAPTQYTKSLLPNGLTLIVKPEQGSGIVAIEVFVKAGAAQERESNAGIGNFIARTLLASTRNKRAETVAAVVDEVGGNFQTQWTPDYTEIRAITTTARFDDAMSLIGDILNNANFESKWVEQVRREILSEITMEGDDIFDLTYQQIRRRLYRDNPYGRPLQGYYRTIRSITTENMLSFYEQYYVPNNIVVSIAGDVTPEHARDRIKIAFAGTSARRLPKERVIPFEPVAESKGEVVERTISAAYIMFGFAAPGATSEDYAAMKVASTALGSGKGSRMFQELREKKALAYDLGTLYPTFKNQSHVLVYLITDPYRRTFPGLSIEMMLTEVKQAMLDEVNKLQRERLTAAELERAKRYAIGRFALDHQRLRDRAFYLGMFEAIGLGCGYDSESASRIEAVTAEDVQRAVQKYLTNYAMTIVLPETKSEK